MNTKDLMTNYMVVNIILYILVNRPRSSWFVEELVEVMSTEASGI